MRNRTGRVSVFILMMLIVISEAYAQSYTTYAVSSNLNKKSISKASVIWIVSDTSSFMWNRSIETSVKEVFEEEGIDALITTDYLDICDIKEDEYQKLVDLYMDSKADLMMVLEVKDLYTYTVGEGIKSIDSTVTLLDYVNQSILLKVELSTESNANDLMSLNATRGPAIESLVEALVKEYLRYVK